MASWKATTAVLSSRPVPAWTWRFYLRRRPLVAGLSLIPSVQRLLVVGWLAFSGTRPLFSDALTFVWWIGLVRQVFCTEPSTVAA